MKTKLNILLAFFMTLAVLAGGCGNKDQKTDDEKKTDSTSQSNQNKIEVAGENKTGTDPKSNELGIKEGMPADFPSDVPQPLNSKCLGSLNTSEGTVVTFESTSRPKEILAPFTEGVEKAGFKKAEGEMMSDDGGMAVWNKEKREVSIMLAWDKDKSVCSVVVTYR